MKIIDQIRKLLTDKELMIMYENMRETRDHCECGSDYNYCNGCKLTNKLQRTAESIIK